MLLSHGNCYVADAVCCMNDAVQCTIGDMCNACPADQTCTTGASTCVGGGESPSTTKNSGPTSLPATHTTVIALPPTSTSLPPSPPTAVASVGSFVNQGCFQDAPSSRILVSDSTIDSSSTGMTVEKCVAFSQENHWQYAGVEFGGYVDCRLSLIPVWSLEICG